MTPYEQVGRLYAAYRIERHGNAPSALILHPDDVFKFRASPEALHLITPQGTICAFGMDFICCRSAVPGFPFCTDRKGAADALEKGASVV